MSQYIPDALRKLVAERAGHRCEYCRISAIDTFFTFHIDHIISLKHGGEICAENLAYTCQICPKFFFTLPLNLGISYALRRVQIF